jgi:hypothetical protein
MKVSTRNESQLLAGFEGDFGPRSSISTTYVRCKDCDTTFHDGDCGAGAAAIHVELRADSAHCSVAGRNLKRPRRVMCDLEQCFPGEKSQSPAIFPHVNLDGRRRVECNQ